MEIKVDLNDENTQKQITNGLRHQLLNGAVKQIVENLTPERMTEFVEHVLEDAFRQYSSWDIAQRLKELAKPMLDRVLAQPEIKARIEEEVKKGVDKALSDLSGEISKNLVTNAIIGIRERR